MANKRQSVPIGYLKIWLVQGSLSTGKRASQPKNGFTVHRKMGKARLNRYIIRAKTVIIASWKRERLNSNTQPKG